MKQTIVKQGLEHKNRILKIIEFLKKELGINSSKKILEVGCFPYFMTKLLNNFWDYYGVDIYPPKNSFKDRICVRDLEIETIPFKSSYFDCVVFAEVIEHLAYPNLVLKEINRVLKNNGFLVITTPNFYSYKHMTGMLVGHGALEHHVNIKGKENDPNSRSHVRLYSMYCLRKTLELFNFKVEKSYFFNWFPDYHILVKMIRPISIIPIFRHGLMVKAIKKSREAE